MSYLKFLAIPIVIGALLSIPRPAPAQVSINIGPEPACPDGSYDFRPYHSAPDGYYGSQWLNRGRVLGRRPCVHEADRLGGPRYHAFYSRHGHDLAHPGRG